MSACYELKDIHLNYGIHTVLSIPSLVIERGVSYAFMGKNGSGKSTLLNLLALLHPHEQGTFTFDGQLVSTKDHHRLRQSIAYLQQKPYLFQRSVFANIELPLKLRGCEKTERHQRVQAMLESLSIHHLANRAANRLSGGEVQKVAIARALIVEPQVLLVDEPFNHLDSGTDERIESLLMRYQESPEHTLIMAMHDAPKAYLLAEHVYHLVDGNVFEGEVMNVFNGRMLADRQQFDTGKLQVYVPENYRDARHIAMDGRQLVLSRKKLDSSMQNEFFGTISAIHDLQNQVQVSVQAGELLHAVISHAALRDLALLPGDEVWLYCKSSSVIRL